MMKIPLDPVAGRSPARRGRGRPVGTSGMAGRAFYLTFSTRAAKAALVDEAESLGLSVSRYIELVLTMLDPRDRIALAAGGAVAARQEQETP